MLANVAEIIRRVLPYDLFAIQLYNERRQDLKIRYAVGHRDDVVRGLCLKLGEGLTGAAAPEQRAGVGGRLCATIHATCIRWTAVRTELAPYR